MVLSRRLKLNWQHMGDLDVPLHHIQEIEDLDRVDVKTIFMY